MAVVYYAQAGEVRVVRAVLRFFKGCIDDVLVYREATDVVALPLLSTA